MNRWIIAVVAVATTMSGVAYAQDGAVELGQIEIPAKIIGWTLATLVLLRGISKFLHFMAKATANTTDDKVANFFAKFLDWGGRIIDAFTANSQAPQGLKAIKKASKPTPQV